MKKSLLFLFSFPLFANTCADLATGNWSAPSSWTSCGGTIPQPGDVVNITAQKITLNTNVSVSNIVVTFGQLVTDGLAPHTITCSASGADCLQCEAANATYSNKPCDFSASTQTNNVTFTASSISSSSNAVIGHRWGPSFFSVTLILPFIVITNGGSGEGVHTDGVGGSDVLTISHCNINNVATAIYAPVLTLSITNCSFSGITGTTTINPNFATTATITDNTELITAASGIFIKVINSASNGWNVSRNAVLGDSNGTFDKGIYQGNNVANTGSSPGVFSNNIGKTYNGLTYPALGNCTGIATSTCNFTQNVFDGFVNGIRYGSYNSSLLNVGIQSSTNQPGQGIYFNFGANNVSSSFDIGGLDSNVGNLAFFSLGSSAPADSTSVTNGTFVGLLPDSGNSTGILFGEGNATPNLNTTNGKAANSLLQSWTSGIASGNSNNTFVTTGTGSVGVYNNDVYNATTAYTASGTGFGTSPAHPSATYGDLSNINPGFVNTRIRFADCDKIFGGPGTTLDLFTQLYNRWNSTNNPRITTANIYTCMSLGFSPQNLKIQTASSGGSFIGALTAVKVLGLGPQ